MRCDSTTRRSACCGRPASGAPAGILPGVREQHPAAEGPEGAEHGDATDQPPHRPCPVVVGGPIATVPSTSLVRGSEAAGKSSKLGEGTGTLWSSLATDGALGVGDGSAVSDSTTTGTAVAVEGSGARVGDGEGGVGEGDGDGELGVGDGDGELVLGEGEGSELGSSVGDGRVGAGVGDWVAVGEAAGFTTISPSAEEKGPFEE